MQPLLKIQSIPIKIEAQTRRASLQYSTEPAPINKPAPLSNMLNRGGTKPARPSPVKITGNPSNASQQQTDNNVQQRQTEYAVRDATQQAVFSNAPQNQSAAAVADTVIGQALMSDYTPTQRASAPVAAPPAPSTSVNYHMDKPTFDWNSSSKPQLEFVPAQIEYNITQYPQLIIEYVGEPIYVPASANPNYKGTA